MIEDDTIKLLRECDAGIKMGVEAIDEVISQTQSPKFREILESSKQTHEKLGDETSEILEDCGDTGKEPNPMAKSMSWLKTNVMMNVRHDDSTVADLMTDGCNMGVKSLNRYLNQYKAADEKSKSIAKRLIRAEADLAGDVSSYL